MDDLINREEFFNRLNKTSVRDNFTEDDFEYLTYLLFIQPAVEPRRGEWIETIKNGKMCRTTTCCGDDQTVLTMWCKPNYCPNCGADMRGEANNEN